MSIPLWKSIMICDNKFKHYKDVAKHMRSILSGYLKGTRDENHHLIKSLKEFKQSIINGANIGIYKYLLKEDLPKVCVDLMKVCIERGDMKVLTALLSCIITFTDNSYEMCEELLDQGLSTLIVNQIIAVCNNNFNVELPPEISADSLYDQLILIIDNIAIEPPFQKNFLRCKDIGVLKDKICHYMKSRDHRTRILTMAALTWLIEKDDDKTRFNSYTDIVDNFVDYIRRGLEEESLRCEGLRVSEMLKVLISLSNIESIKHSMIANTNLRAVITDIIQSDKPMNEEKSRALGVLRNLCFSDVTIAKNGKMTLKIQDVCNVLNLVKPLAKSSEPGIKKQTEAILSEVNDDLKDRQYDIKYDFFFSYHQRDEDMMKKIIKIFLEMTYMVCRVEQDLSNSDMWNKIGQSRIIVIGLSSLYYSDSYCRSESQSAHSLKKSIAPVVLEQGYTPKDWLEKIIESYTIIDFSNKDEFDACVKKLIEYGKSQFGLNSPKRSRPKKLSKSMKSVSLNYTFITEKKVEDWSAKEILQWCEYYELSHIIEKLKPNVGKMIIYYRDLKNNAYETYEKRVYDELKLSSIEAEKFNEAIDKLIDK